MLYTAVSSAAGNRFMLRDVFDIFLVDKAVDYILAQPDGKISDTWSHLNIV